MRPANRHPNRASSVLRRLIHEGGGTPSAVLQRRWQTSCLWLLVFVVASFMFLPLEPAYGRAGGGGGYGGGGGGFSGGGFSGGGGFRGYGGSGRGKSWEEMNALERMFVVGFVGAIISVFVINSLQRMRGGWRRDQVQSIQEYGGYTANQRSHQAVAATIQALDPEFDPDHFAQRFRRAFLEIQEAWQTQDLERVCHFISDGIYERFTLQIEEQRERGYRDHMEQISVESVLLAETRTTEVFDTLTVQVNASAIDYRVSLATGKRISGSTTPGRFVEFWSFVRRSGVRSGQARAGLFEGNCPNCGAPVRLNRFGHCEACQAVVRSGQYDWVLAEITQACEWRPRTSGTDTLVLAYRQKDPGFSLQHLEDRTSVIFWRKAMADRLGQVNPLLKMASTDFCHQYQARLNAASTNGGRSYVGDCAVGSVEVLGIVSDETWDLAQVEVRWAGTEMRSGTETRGEWGRRRSLFVLGRRPGVKTEVEFSIGSAHCAHCGAPETDMTSHACQYCQSVLNTGEFDWILLDHAFWHSQQARQWRTKLEAQPSVSAALPSAPALGTSASAPPRLASVELLGWLIQVLAADRELDEKEAEALRRLADKNKISEPVLQNLIEKARQGDLENFLPQNFDLSQGREWLEQMADIALADGTVSRPEMSVLTRLGGHLGLVRADVQLIVNKRRVYRHQLARENRRAEELIK